MEESRENPGINDILNSILGTSNLEHNFQDLVEHLSQRLCNVISSEKVSIESEKHRIDEERVILEEKHAKELSQIEAEIKLLESEKELLPWQGENIIEFNIGGTTHIATSRSTLIKYPDSVLAQLFSGKFELPIYQGKVFIDRDGEAFSSLLSYLRTGRMPIFRSLDAENSFLAEAEYWNIPLTSCELIDESLRYFDPDWVSPSFELDSNCTILRKLDTNHGLASTSHPLTKKSPYIEFKINLAASTHNLHIFIGAVDRSRYRPSQLFTLCSDAYMSWFWEVWNCKLIRTDENGVQSTANHYGCECEDEETILGMYYDELRRTISYYKNGICQGVAFSNVPAGMYPCIVVWFEAGSVTLLQNLYPKQLQFI